jgi:hypothetical protein
MAIERQEGAVQPGIKWWRFTTRIPGVHVGFSLPEIIQGGLLTTATGGVVAALCMQLFQLPFEVAWSVVLIQLVWVFIVPVLVLGEPYAPGWITPALPLVMAFIAKSGVGLPAIQMMTAVTICLCVILLFFAVTGLAARFFSWVPVELRAAIIFGGSIAAFTSEFGRLAKFPYTLPIVWAAVLILMFSVWYAKARAHNKFMNWFASIALLVGFLAAAVAGPLLGELSFDIKMGWQVPQIGAFLTAISPFSIGWPSWSMYVTAMPMALMIYIFIFGDIILGNAVLESAGAVRKDEKIETDVTRSHAALFIRNMGHLLSGGPFIPLHGPVWTGVHVFLAERYKTGRRNMDSFFTGTFNWYWLAFILIFLVPVVSFMRPLLPIALSITLILTGFACAYIAISMVKTPASMGYMVFVGMVIAKFGPAWGLAVGVGLYLLMLIEHVPGINAPRAKQAAEKDVNK